MRIAGIILSICTGFLFLYSGWAKLDSVEFFELKLVEHHLSGWKLAPYTARLIISVELWLGVMLLLNLQSRKFSGYSILFLIIMEVYLGLVLVLLGNEADCGCFGDAFAMTTTESMTKNALMIGMLVFVRRQNIQLPSRIGQHKASVWLRRLMLPVIIIASGIINPPFDIYNYDFTYNYEAGSKVNDWEVWTGCESPCFAVFVSARCKHCRQVLRKFEVLSQQSPEFENVQFFIAGKEEKINEFFSQSVFGPTATISKYQLIDYTGGLFPLVYLISNDSIIEVYNKKEFMSATDEELFSNVSTNTN